MDPNNRTAQQALTEATKAVATQRWELFALGEYAPNTTNDRLLLLTVTLARKRYLSAAEQYRELFAADPTIVNDRQTAHRVHAALAALRAALGQDAIAKLDTKTVAEWRSQALAWLRAELVTWPQRTPVMVDLLLADDVLTTTRPGLQRHAWSADERAAWDAFWADVQRLRAKGP